MKGDDVVGLELQDRKEGRAKLDYFPEINITTSNFSSLPSSYRSSQSAFKSKSFQSDKGLKYEKLRNNVYCNLQAKICGVVTACACLGIIVPLLINMNMPIGAVERTVEYYCSINESSRIEALRGYNVLGPEVCQKRKCCWILPESDFSSPACFHRFPSPYGYYVYSTEFNYAARKSKLKTLPESNAQTPYLTKMEELLLLHYGVFSKNHTLLQISPDDNAPTFLNEYSDITLQALKPNDYFRFYIRRNSTGETLLNSVMGPFIFSKDYIEFSMDLPEKGFIYGLGGLANSAINLPHNRERLTLYNRKGLNNPFISSSFPFFLSLEASGMTHGIYFETTYPIEITLLKSNSLNCKLFGGDIKMHIFDGPNPMSVIQELRKFLKVQPEFPPYWMFGFHMCRDTTNYEHKKIWFQMNAKSIPFDSDCIKAGMTFNEQSIDSEGKKGIKTLHQNGKHFWLPLEPQIKVGSNLSSLNAFVMHNGKKFEGMYRNNRVNYIDPWGKDIYTFYKVFFSKLNVSLDGIIVMDNQPYNQDEVSQPGPQPYVPDMEGSVSFSSNTIAQDAVHGNTKFHLQLHNSYSAAHIQAIRHYLLEAYPNKRIPVLSESVSLNSIKWGGHWTPGQASSWWALQSAVSGMLTSSLAGFPYFASPACGSHDLPGHDINGVLCFRWHQISAFFPLHLTYTGLNQSFRDPSTLSGTLPKEIAKIIMMRYSTVPYIYTYYHLANQKNKPFIYPLFFDYPNDTLAIENNLAFMFGPFIYVSPVMEKSPSRKVYFPKGCWYDFITLIMMSCSSKGTNIQVPAANKFGRAYFKGGSIVAAHGSIERSLNSLRKKEFELWVILNDHWRAEGQLIIDDGITNINSPTYWNLNVHFTYKSSMLTIQRDGDTCRFVGDISTEIQRVTLLGLKKRPENITMETKTHDEWIYNADVLTLSIFNASINFCKQETSVVRLNFDWN